MRLAEAIIEKLVSLPEFALATSVQKAPAICTVEMADAYIPDLIRRAHPAIHRDFVIDKAGVMRGAATGLAAVELNRFIAPTISNRAARRSIQLYRHFVRVHPKRCKTTTDRTVAL